MKKLFTSLFVFATLILTTGAVFACDCNCATNDVPKCNCAKNCDCGNCKCETKKFRLFRKNKCNCEK